MTANLPSFPVTWQLGVVLSQNSRKTRKHGLGPDFAAKTYTFMGSIAKVCLQDDSPTRVRRGK